MSEKSIPLQTGGHSNQGRSSGESALRVVDPGILMSQMNETFNAIARRAFELFERDGWIQGRDLEHWIQAESEFLHPVHMRVSESRETLTVDAEVPGFEADELQVSLEPRRLTITGKKENSREEKENQTLYKDQCRGEIMRSMELPVEVDPARATATLRNGILELSLPKAANVRSTQVQVKAASGGR